MYVGMSMGHGPTVLASLSLCKACLHDVVESMSVHCTVTGRQSTSQSVNGKALKVLDGQICPRWLHVHAEDATGSHSILLDA